MGKSTQELAILCKRNADNTLLSDLYYQNIKLFESVVFRFKDLAEKEDLMQECFFAMLMALNNYDETAGEFTRYLRAVTRRHIYRYIQESGTIRVPEYLQNLIYKYLTLKDAEKTDPEIMDALNITEDKLRQIKQTIYQKNIDSLDALTSTDFSLYDAKADTSAEFETSVIDNVFNDELAIALSDEMGSLTDRQKRFVTDRFYKGYGYKEIDPEHSEGNTRMIIEKALIKMGRSKRLKRFYDETNFCASSGFYSFKYSNTSIVERLVIKIEEL